VKIPWKEANEGQRVMEEQFQERFCRRRQDGFGLDTVTKEFLAIEFKRTQDGIKDARGNYAEKANRGCPRSVQEFADRSPSGRSSQRVDGTTNSVCGKDVRIRSC
jgi:hypothetical protein